MLPSERDQMYNRRRSGTRRTRWFRDIFTCWVDMNRWEWRVRLVDRTVGLELEENISLDERLSDGEEPLNRVCFPVGIPVLINSIVAYNLMMKIQIHSLVFCVSSFDLSLLSHLEWWLTLTCTLSYLYWVGSPTNNSSHVTQRLERKH